MRTEKILNLLLDFRRVVGVPAIITRLPPFDFPRAPIDSVAANNRLHFGGSAAFGVVDFAEIKLKVRVGCFFCTESETTQGDSFCIDTVVLKGAHE